MFICLTKTNFAEVKLHHTNQCNYATPTVELYIAFTLDVILHHKNLLPLVLQQRAPLGKGDDVPAWVWNLGDEEVLPTIDKWYLYWGWISYKACAGHDLDVSTLFQAKSETSSNIRTLTVTGIAVDTIAVLGTRLDDISPQNSAQVAEMFRSWMDIARKYHQKINNGLQADRLEEVFYKVLVSERIRNNEQHVVRVPNKDDLADIAKFVSTGKGTVNNLWFWDRYVGNQIFFVTRNGRLGLGHQESAVGDEVWVFDGGRVPFTVRSRKGGEKGRDFDFVGSCYVYNIM